MDTVETAARSIRNALEGGIPFLRLGEEGKAVVLAFRKRGETIEDDDCDVDFEAGQTMVFRRFPASIDGKDTFRWLGWCRLDEREIADFLRPEIQAMGHVERESLSLDAAWQSMQWQEASGRAEERERRTGPRP